MDSLGCKDRNRGRVSVLAMCAQKHKTQRQTQSKREKNGAERGKDEREKMEERR